MTQPDDRELEQYLKGGSALSRRYRDASGERSPPDLDEAILARARAELRRKPHLNRYLAPVALAASVVLGVNLAWNVHQAAPVPGAGPRLAEKSRDNGFVAEPPPAAPAPQPERKARAAAPAPAAAPREAERDAALDHESRERLAKSEARVTASDQAESRRSEPVVAQESAGAAAPPAALAPSTLAPSTLADAAPMSEAAKIDHLIDYIGKLAGATFVRNGKDYGPTEAARHLQYKREKAGDRVRTADDFIRLCASQSSLSGEAYLIRFADGRTRTAEDVLREELARINP
jgi:hypothetical protein